MMASRDGQIHAFTTLKNGIIELIKDFELASFEDSEFFLDKQEQLWRKLKQHPSEERWISIIQIPVPARVVSVRDVKNLLDQSCILLDIHGQVWQAQTVDKQDCSQWQLVENLPPIRMAGKTPNELFLVALDGQLWSFTTRKPVEGFPPVLDIGHSTKGSTLSILGLSGEVFSFICSTTPHLDPPGRHWEIPAVAFDGEADNLIPLYYQLVNMENLPPIVSIENHSNVTMAIDNSGKLWAWGYLPDVEWFSATEASYIPGPKNLVRCVICPPFLLAISKKYVWILGSHNLETEPPKESVFTALKTFTSSNSSIRRYSIPFNSCWLKNYPNTSSAKSANNKPSVESYH